MKNIDIILNYIKSKVTKDYILNCIKNNILCGVTALEIQDNLNILRNNSSTILGELWKSSQLIKINTRPVAFIPTDVIREFKSVPEKNLCNCYTSDEIKRLVNYIAPQQPSSDPFQYLVGSKDSLSNQINQAKAALIYPPKGLNTLILGESGVGKTTFAYAMHEFGKSKKKVSKDEFPFISFNCSDYFNNPQLLLSQLFGHIKGAFTGADNEKIGLVEKADGGILFLDEIHRLPPNGQEMLFYLMDKGEFHRMGETENKRKSSVLIIAATTEEPNGNLLSTFLRRIPVVITLPSFREKTIDERVQIIQSLFSYESKNLGKNIRVSSQVLKSLALYKFNVGNIGQLRSEIKLLCAKSFLNHLQNDKELIIKFNMLDNEIREYYLNYNYPDRSVQTYLNMYTEDMIISPLDEKGYYPDESKKDIYELIIKTLENFKSKGLSKEIIETKINSLIDDNFKELMESFSLNKLYINQLYKIVSKDITDFSVELISIAENELSIKFNNKFIFGFALHVQALLKRIAEEKPIRNPNMIKIKRDYPNEFRVSEILVKLLNEKFRVLIPEDERGFLTILLANNKLYKKHESGIGIFVICHGYGTASSIVNVANTLLNVDYAKAIDMPLDADITETYDKIKSIVVDNNNGKGVLFLVDMGSLTGFGEKIMNETGIKIRTINNVSTLIVIEALRNVLYKNDNLNTIYNSLTNAGIPISSPLKPVEKIILTLCATGHGASVIAKNILNQILNNKYNDRLKIVTSNYIDSENITDLQSKYDIVAIIGTFNPNINVPYFPINKLLNESFQREFLKFIDSNFNDHSVKNNVIKSVYETSKEMLEEYVKFINPKIAIINIKKFIESISLGNINETSDDIIDLIIHLGCMLDRCVNGNFVKFENIEEYKEKNIEQFNEIRKASNILETEYNIKINDDEICYIIKITNRYL
ncbi:sigma 54-interacting transcriptional regulator [Clostridium pasteurianum]|uniref:Transcriptional antiterminator n=1 Tax=Clostridium pasteurianum BC1 TaxID=86416 RepID=R4K7N0_CLOPA|nr:sigma 54-interacting transcriptional regulator [Clostridium pasteurianum]AGK98543.1 transcriptional antiterminator [Clostridium pasteurianum BC1]